MMVFQKLLPIFVGNEFVPLSGRRAIFLCVVSVDGGIKILLWSQRSYSVISMFQSYFRGGGMMVFGQWVINFFADVFLIQNK